MTMGRTKLRIGKKLIFSGVIIVLMFSLLAGHIALAMGEYLADQKNISNPEFTNEEGSIVYLPLTMRNHPWVSPFGVENNRQWKPGTKVYQYGDELNSNWVRMGIRVSWRELQPNEGDPIQWDKLTEFEDELRELKALEMTPVVIVYDNPHWAVQDVRNDHQLTSCASLQSSKFSVFADFLVALVEKYEEPEFNVHHWEIYNEPDVDPNLVPPDSGFGCWGDIGDRYYGGRYYGEMLKVVGRAIKAEDPDARVWIGGLLLDTNNPGPGEGNPQRFFEGILEAGIGTEYDYFDVVPFHWYTAYSNQTIDHDLYSKWGSDGGGVIGKSRHLKGLMTNPKYGVNKTLFLNEISLMCIEASDYCAPPTEDFYEMQGNYLVRTIARGFSEGIAGYIWFTLNGPGWRHTGLLDENNEPKLVYAAYKVLIAQLIKARYIGAVDYGAGVEAYAFKRGAEIVDIVWGIENSQFTISISENKFISATSRDGDPLTPDLVGNTYQLVVGFEPIYILRKP
jgi:hypothetical protein